MERLNMVKSIIDDAASSSSSRSTSPTCWPSQFYKDWGCHRRRPVARTCMSYGDIPDIAND
jgi:hypothetical protein